MSRHASAKARKSASDVTDKGAAKKDKKHSADKKGGSAGVKKASAGTMATGKASKLTKRVVRMGDPELSSSCSYEPVLSAPSEQTLTSSSSARSKVPTGSATQLFRSAGRSRPLSVEALHREAGRVLRAYYTARPWELEDSDDEFDRASRRRYM